MWLRKFRGGQTSAGGNAWSVLVPLLMVRRMYTEQQGHFYTNKDQKRVKNRDKDLKDKPSEVTIVAEKTKKAKKLQADQQRSLRKYRHIDHGIFGKLTIVGHARDVNMQEMLTYELIPSPSYYWTSYVLRGMTRMEMIKLQTFAENDTPWLPMWSH